MRNDMILSIDNISDGLIGDVGRPYTFLDRLKAYLGNAYARVRRRADNRQLHQGQHHAARDRPDFAEIDRTIVDALRHSFSESCVRGVVGASTDDVHGKPRPPQLLLAEGIELRELGDRGHPAQKLQTLETLSFDGGSFVTDRCGPLALRNRANLLFDLVDEGADLPGNRVGLQLQIGPN